MAILQMRKLRHGGAVYVATAAQPAKSRGEVSNPGCVASEFTTSSPLKAAATSPGSWFKTQSVRFDRMRR